MDRERAADAALLEAVSQAIERSRALVADSAQLLEDTRELRAHILDLKRSREADGAPDAQPG